MIVRPTSRARRRCPVMPLLFATLGTVSAAGAAHAATIYVSPPKETISVEVDAAGDGRCSITEAVQAAVTDSAYGDCSAGSGTDDIIIPAGTFRLPNLLFVNDTYGINIGGQGADKTVIDGDRRTTTAFWVGDGGIHRPSFGLFGVTLTHFNSVALAFQDAGSANISNAVLSENHPTTNEGGAIVYSGIGLFIANTTFVKNGAIASGFAVDGVPRGGAISSLTDSPVYISNSTFDGNNAGQNGGAIYNRGPLELYNVTFGNNKAEFGGGAIYNTSAGAVTIRNCTFWNNEVTSSGSASAGGGGIANANGGTVLVQNTILAGSKAAAGGKDCHGTLTSNGYNIIQNVSGCEMTPAAGDQFTDPKLTAFSNWGGLVAAYRPSAESPAIDHGSTDTTGAGACTAKDYRGIRRIADGDKDGVGRCDVGAMEVGAALLVAGSTTLGAGDAAIRKRMENDLGFVVFIGDDDVMTAANTAGKNVVVLSESGASGVMGFRFRDVQTPVMVLEPHVYDDMALTGAGSEDYGTTPGLTSLTIVDAHAMAAGLTGAVTTTTSGQPYGFGRALAPGAKCVARPNATSSRCMIFRIGKDDVLANGTKAPARRVGFFATQAAAAALSSDGGKLFDASFLWASGGAGL